MSVDDIRQKQWDFGLTVITVFLLGALGVQSFIGTIYVWWAQRSDPAWMDTGYAGYVDTMNLIAAPLLVALVVVMGLCVPKRLFSRGALIISSLAMIAVGVGVGVVRGSLTDGLTAYLMLAAGIQVAVVALTAAGRGGTHYLTEGRLTRLGSGLLHLGFIVFGIVIASLQHSELMLPVFWAATAFMTTGTVMSFYASSLSSALRGEVSPRESSL